MVWRLLRCAGKAVIDLGGGTVFFLEDFVENLGAKFIKSRVRQTKRSTEKSYRRRVKSKKIQRDSLKMLKMALILRKIAVHIILNTFMIFLSLQVVTLFECKG